MNHIKPKLAALLCTFALTTTACDLLELDPINDTDVSSTDTSSDSDTSSDTGINDTSDKDTPDNDTSNEHDYEQEAAITKFGWDKVKALNEHFCHLAMTCPERDPELVRELSRFITPENCVDSGPWSLMIGDLTDTHTAINAGRLKFNPVKVEECFQAIKFASTACDFDTYYAEDIHIENPCDEVFTPQQADGEDCFKDAECFSGECQRDPDDLETCELATCADTRSRPDIVGPGDDCTHDICDIGLFCVDQHNVCKPVTVKDLYETCDPDIGEVCDEDAVCVFSTCIETPIFVSEGENCDDYIVHCKTGLSCNYMGDEEPSQCEPVGTEGDACERKQQCKVGFWCDYDLGQCAPESDWEEPCTDDEACTFGMYCDDWPETPVCDYWPIDYDEEFCSL